MELRRPQLEIVAPRILGIEVVGRNREQLAGGAGIREIEDVLGLEQTVTGEVRIARLEDLVAEGEGGGQAAGEVGTDLGSGRTRPEDGPMPDEAKGGIADVERVV